MLTRRSFIQRSVALGSLAFWAPGSLMAMARSGAQQGPPILINLFLRGGADGLALVPPVGDPACSASASNPLAFGDGMFALHPEFAPLFSSVSKSEVTGVHAVHSNDTSLSHFNAMALSDRGNEPVGPGWMMAAAATNNLLVPLNNVSLGSSINPCLIGGPSATLTGVSDLLGIANNFETILGSIDRMWKQPHAPTLLANVAGNLVQLVDDLKEFGPDSSTVTYPLDAPEGLALKEAARLIKESPSVAHIAINSGSINNGARWDTHAGQTTSLRRQIAGLAGSIAAFRDDIGDHWDRTIIVIQTEFGRTAVANNLRATSTQHGHATAMLLVGGPIANSPTSGEIAVSQWPGIGSSQKYLGKYLDKTTDVRTVLSEVLIKHMRCSDVSKVFPTFDAAANPELGILETPGELGDADGSGTVDRQDVQQILSHLIGDSPPEFSETLADFNGSRTLDLTDALGVARHLQG